MLTFRRWVSPPTFPENERNHLALLTHTVLMLTVAFTLLGSLAALFASVSVLGAILPSAGIVLMELFALYLLGQGRVQVAAWMLASFLWLGLVIVVMLMGGFVAGTLPLLLVVVLIAALTVGPRANLVFTMATLVFISGLFVLEITEQQFPVILSETALNTWISTTTAIVSTSIFTHIAMRSLRVSTVSQEYMDSIIQSMSDMLLVLDRDLRIETVNQALLEQLGYTEAELLGQPFSIILPPDKATIPIKVTALLTDPDGGFYVNTDYRTHDGGSHPVRLTASPIREDNANRILCVAQDLTDLLRTQRELRHERNLLRTLLDSLPDYIHVKAPDGRYLVSNRAHSRILGASSPGEVVGKTSADFFDKQVAAPYKADDNHIYRTGEPLLGVEREGIDSDGNTIWIYTNKVPLKDENGTITGIVAIGTDITRRKQDEARLRKSEARNRALLAAMPDTVLVLDDVGRHIEVKAENTADLLAPPDEIIGQTIADLLPPGHTVIHRYLSTIQRCLTTGEPQTLTYTLDQTLGGRAHFETRVVRLNRREVVCVVRNITDQHEAEMEIHNRELMYRTLARNLPRTAVMLYDQDLRVLIAEGEALTEFGYSREMMEGNRLPEIYPAIFERHGEDYRRALKGENIYREIEVPEKQNHYTVTYLPCRNDEDKIFAGMVVSHDVTADRHRTQEIRQYADALEQSNSELESFAYIASHDLQEPLRKIQAFSGRLSNHIGDNLDPTANDYLNRMTSAADRMQQLIADLLSLSRVTTQAQPFALVDLENVWQGVLLDLELQIEQTNATVVAEMLPTIEAERSQIRQLLQNILTNALKYRREDTAPHITLGVSYTNPNTVTLTFNDNGIGFDPKHAERIFGPFQRLHGRGRYTGTGIGLAICRKIAERHKGMITAFGEPGIGACFTVTLPRTQQHTTEEDTHGQA